MQTMRVFCVKYQIQLGQLLNTAAFGLLSDVKETLNYFNDHGEFMTWPSTVPGKFMGLEPLTEQLHCNIATFPYEVYCWRSFRMKQPLGISLEDAVYIYFKKIGFKALKSELGAVMPRGRSFERRAAEFFAKGQACNEFGLEIDAKGKVKRGQDWCGVVPLRDWKSSNG
jgi:hypothetical protein